MKTFIILILAITNFCLFSQVKKPVELKHNGFYARTTLGLGSTSLSERANITGIGKVDMKISGLSYDIAIQAGYSVIKNLEVYGVFGANLISSPTYSFNGEEAYVTSKSNVNLTRYGAGVTYYLPDNLYASFDLTSARDEIEISGSTAKSQTGLIFGFGVGKEWWIAKKLGLGGMVYLFTGSIDDEPIEGQTPKIGNTGFGLALSLTYN